eukprot:s999_g7.t1
MQVFFSRKDPDVEAAEDQKETTGEAVFKQVVPGTTEAMQLPGATEELHLEEMEDETPKRASSTGTGKMSQKSDQDDQSRQPPGQKEWETVAPSKPDQNATSARHGDSPPHSSTLEIPSNLTPLRSVRRSEVSNHSASRGGVRRSGVSNRSSARRSVRSKQSKQSKQSEQSGQSAFSTFTGITRRSVYTVFTAVSKMTALSRAGEDFQHHFGTSTALQPQIVGATGQKSVMRTQLEGPDGMAEKPVKAGLSAIPKNVRLPALLLALCAFCNLTAYAIEFATFAIYFKQVHSWNEAKLAGVAQTAGDLMAAVSMQVIPVLIGSSYDPDRAGCLRRFFHNLLSQPYNLSFALATWVIFHIGLCCPVLAVAIVAQVLMGTTFVYASKWISDMNTFYSMGDSTTFLSLQVACRNAEAFGGAAAGAVGIGLFTLDPLAPFAFAASLCGVTFLIYTVGFCARLGFGDDIEAAEAKRARRKGVKRVSSWAVDTRASQIEGGK